MIRFWLATFGVDPKGPASAAAPLAGASRLAIEILNEDYRWAVLVSTVDDLDDPTTLTSVIAFTNAPDPANLWHDRGFPLVDAAITLDKSGALIVTSPCFFEADRMRYDAELFRLSGIDFSLAVPDKGRASQFKPAYHQQIQTPDPAQPATFVVTQAAAWVPSRTDVTYEAKSKLRLDVTDVRCPTLEPLKSGTTPLTRFWSGNVVLPKAPAATSQPLRVPRPDTFAVSAFRFENVEIFGFRIDLAAFGRDFTRDLARLIEPLNFHLGQSSTHLPLPDFRYRVATPTVLIELLRYNRMRSKDPAPPMLPDDSQSQHELVVRLLVGRVDDDTAQASDPAVYVPAIFVDNAWSKALGRDMLGYDKRMADFWGGPAGMRERLLPDGCIPRPVRPQGTPNPPNDQVPLTDVSLISLVTNDRRPGPSVLEIDFSSKEITDLDPLEMLNMELAFGDTLLAGIRWRQSDFSAAEFQRSFSMRAMAESLRAFRSVQASPLVLDGRPSELQSWVNTTFVLGTDLQFSLPIGVATLRLHRTAGASAWNQLVTMLGDGRTADLNLPTGTSYRMVCSMDLKVDDGLDWSGP